MFLSNALDQGLDLIPTCEALCLVDMRAGLVLGKSSVRSVPQEEFDRLADCAAMLFSDELGMSRLTGSTLMDQYSVHRPDGLLVFARAPNEPDHVLCYRCGPDGDLTAINNSVRTHRNNVAEFLLES